jgi:hypothetical protein
MTTGFLYRDVWCCGSRRGEGYGKKELETRSAGKCVIDMKIIFCLSEFFFFFFGNKIAITQEQRLQPFKEGKKQQVDHHHYKQ